jgi:transposase-like protein
MHTGLHFDDPVKQQKGITVREVCRGISLNAKLPSLRQARRDQQMLVKHLP